MQEQEKQEKVLQMINLYAINKYIQKMLVSKTKRLTLAGRDGSCEMIMLEELSNIVKLDEQAKN